MLNSTVYLKGRARIKNIRKTEPVLFTNIFRINVCKKKNSLAWTMKLKKFFTTVYINFKQIYTYNYT